jgi:UrcA family protein
MTSFASRISGLVLAAAVVLPAQALAATAVKVSDLDLLTPAGASAFAERAERAADRFCADVRDLGVRASCEAGVKAELSEKVAVLQAAQRQRANTAVASR